MTRRIGDVVLEVEDLHTYCFTRWGVVKAVDGVSFSLRQGEALGIVQTTGVGELQELLVRDAAPQEEREPRGELVIADAIGSAIGRTGGIAFGS